MNHKELKIILILQIFICSIILGSHLFTSDPKGVWNNISAKDDISLSSTAVYKIGNYSFKNDLDYTEVSQDGQFLALADSSNKLYLLDMFNVTNKFIWNHSFAFQIRDIAISDDGKYVIAGVSDRSISMFNHTGHMWDHSITNLVYSVDISEDGKFAVAGTAEPNVTLFYRNGTVKWHYNTGYTAAQVSMSGDGQYIISGDHGTNLTVFNNTEQYMWNYTMTRAFPAAISKNGQFIVSGDQYNKTFLLFNINDGKNYIWSHNITVDPWYADISDDGRYIVVGGYNYSGPPKAGNVTLLNNEIGYMWHFNVGAADVTDVAISGDGNFAVAGDSSGFFRLFNRNNEIWNINLSNRVESIAISQDGSYIFAVAGNHLYIYYNDFSRESPSLLPLIILLQEMDKGSQTLIIVGIVIISISIVLGILYIYYKNKS